MKFAAFRQWLNTEEQGIGRILVGSMAAGFTFLALAILAAFWVTGRTETHTQWVNHTYEVEVTLGKLRTLTEQAEAIRRGYMIMPELGEFLTAYDKANADIDPTLERLRALTSDNPVQRNNIARLSTMMDELVVQRSLTNRLASSGHAADAIRSFKADTAARRMANVRETMTAMEEEEHRLLAIRDGEQRASVRAFYIALAVTGALLLLVALTSLFTVLRYTREITQSRDTLARLNNSLEDVVQERTADLSRANEEIQRFAYIVSHDLRAPLVNVMGFTAELDGAAAAVAELIDRAEQVAPDIVTEEARLAAREDLPEAIGFIRTSTAKMDRLINAILKLSREGRRVLTPERIDLAELTLSIRDTLQHQLDAAGAEVVAHTPLPGVTTDRFALEQILSNLIENAVKYLKPGRPGRIEVSAERQGPRLTISVKDNGRGIDPRDHSRIFDLFRRSGQQDQPGEGIGLAHVRALAYRLGGVIDVTSELDQGAVFRLNLPTTLTDLGETR